MMVKMVAGETTTRELKEVADELMHICKLGGTTMMIVVANDRIDEVIEVRTVEMDHRRVRKLLSKAVVLIDNPDVTAIADSKGFEHVLDENGLKN